MTGTPNPLPQPAPVARPEPEPSRRLTAWIVLGVLLLTAAGAAGLYAARRKQPSQPAQPVARKTAVVKRGVLEVKVRLSGATSASKFANIVAPKLRSPDSGAMTLLQLMKSGDRVTKGGVVALFDPQNIKDHLDDTIAGYRDKENDVKKKAVQLELDMENLLQSLRIAKANLDKARLDFKTTPIRTAIDNELLQLAIDEAEVTYREKLNEVELKKKSQAFDARITEISRMMEEQHVERHRDDLSRLTVKTPIDGMVVVGVMNRNMGDQVTYAEGDRVYPGSMFMRVVDPASMQLEGTVNQAESGQFHIGQEAEVELDAYPGYRYKGRVAALGALAVTRGREQYYQRTLPIRIRIQNPDSKMLPDLTGAADVIVHREEHVLLAPTSAVQFENGKSYVEVQTREGIQRRPVNLGESQGVHVEVESGLSEGDVVVINQR